MGLVIVCVLLASAAPEGGGATIEDAVRLAVRRSPALAGAAAAGEAARARVDAAGSAWLPRVGVEARYRYQGPLAELVLDTGLTLPGQTEPLVVRRELGSAHNADAFVTIGWRALDLGVRAARVDAAEAAARAAALDEEARAVELAFATRVACLGLLLAEEGERVTQAALRLALETREDVARRREAGLGSAAALAGADLRVTELEARASDASVQVAVARVTVESLIGPGVRLGDTLETALMERPTTRAEHAALGRLRASEAALADQGRAIRASRAPTLDVFARAGVQYPATLADSDEAGLAWVAGATLTWEIWDGGRIAAESDEAGARAREARHGREALAEEPARVQAEAEARTIGAEAQLATVERRLAAAETYLVAARGALAAGVRRATDVQAAEGGLDEARLTRAKALHQRALAEAQRRRALGFTTVETTP